MSAPFTDTYILECNRVHSAQYNDDENTSVWTNSVNDGIKVEAGDKIQVHSAFVSDLGAEDATIEFRGKPIQDEVVLEKTIPTYTHPNINYPTYYGKISNVNTPQTYTDVTDNRVLIETEYYKNANGEYYFTLPLEYGNPLEEQNKDWALGPRHLITDKVAPFHFTASEGYGANTLAPEIAKRLGDDYTALDYIEYKNDQMDIEHEHIFTQIANDNSRYTIYRLTNCEREKQTNASDNVLIRDPALYNYTRVKNIIDFEVDKGFNSPANIATQVTEALSKPTVSSVTQYQSQLSQKLSPTITSPSYQLFECATPDRYNIANASEYFGYAGQPSYSEVTGSPASVIHYAAQYECIGIKRPEFYDAGCNMSNVVNGGIDVPPNMAISGISMPSPLDNDGYGLADFTIKPIVTNIIYNDDNLEALKKFFDSQDYHPELFDLTNSTLVYNDGGLYQEYGGESITKNTHRLLHLNPRVNASMGYTMNACTTKMSTDNEREFGSDNYHDYRNASGGSLTGEDSRSTYPFFIRYFPEFKNDKTNGINYDINTGRGLWGGFAFKAKVIKRIDEEPTMIAFYAPVPSAYTDEVGGKRYLTLGDDSFRKIGYDRHFTAYGNSAICLYNGLQSKFGWSYDRTSVVVGDGPIIDVNTGWYKQIYVGAKNPLLNFDSGKSRFELSQLHTNEVIDTPVNTSLSGLPDDAGDPVYKFNKTLGYRNYSPTMAPYSYVNIFPDTDLNGITYTNKHGAILPNTIYDSLSGMFMTKFGINEKNWKNSFWGIAGFAYSDLNFTTGNTNGRITSNNTSELLYVTTNADVLTSAQMGFNSNTQGAPSYLPQLNSVRRIINSTHNHQNDDAPEYSASDITALYPPTQVSANSATIDALDLPTKTLRPYYTIRSDIITDSNYFGGKDEPSVMPVISVLDKMNQFGDFFYSGGPGQIEFTATQSKTITEVKTQICDPSGAPAVLSPNSCVIYKIIKTNNANLNIIQDIINSEQKKK
jgi:hypothetical protein